MLVRNSLLGQKLSKTGKILNNSANIQITKFQEKVQLNSRLYEILLKNLIIDKFDSNMAVETANKFFNKELVKFVAIDGTEYAKQFFDMVIFYAGAYSCSGTIDFKDSLKTTYQEKFLDKGEDISSCIPVYINKIPEIDSSFHNSQNHQHSILDQFSEESILDNTNISKYLMTFSEFFLAYKMAKSKQTDVIFMDRSLSNMYSSLLYDTSNKTEWEETSSLLNFKIDDTPFDINDFVIARYGLINQQLKIPPFRGDYLRYSIYFELLKNESLDLSALFTSLEIDTTNKTRIKKVEKFLKSWIDEGVVELQNNKYYIKEKYKTTWTRNRSLVDLIGKQIFTSENDPFVIVKEFNGREKNEWITTTDLAFLTLFTFYHLVEECWKNDILLIGITKDTIARDFSNHLIPIGIENSLWTVELEEDLTNTVSDTVFSDRTLLQTISLVNSDSLKVPWSIIEYDSAFVMAIPDLKNRKGYVSGAVRNKITTNKLFLRSFIQLEEAKTDNRLRSNVLFIDRLVYPEFDNKNNTDSNTTTNKVEFIHDYNGEEKVDFLLYKDNTTKNPIQNLIISILKSMSAPSISETFGYNKPLYIADKVAKWHNEEFRKIVDSTILLISNKKNLRNFLFYMNTFRERRQEFETNRRFG